MTRIRMLFAAAGLCSLGAVYAQQEDKAVVTVNGIAIKQSTFDQAVQQVIRQGGSVTPQVRQTVRDQLIARELFVQEAMKQKLEVDPEVLAIAEEAKRNAMIQRYLKSTIQPNPVTDAQLREEYERIKAGLGSNDFKLRVIQLATQERAQEFLAQLQNGRDFAELAQKESLSASGQRGGELDWLSFKTPAQTGQTGGLPLPIAQAVEKLTKGKISEPIPVNDLWWLVKLEDLRPTRIPSVEEVTPALRNKLAAKQLERATTELVQRLMKEATITQ